MISMAVARGCWRDRPKGRTTMSVLETFQDHARVMAAAAERLARALEQVAGELHDCFARGNKLLACGNGGQRLRRGASRGRAGRAVQGRPAGLARPGSVGRRDGDPDRGRQRLRLRHGVCAPGRGAGAPGDLLFAISTSGNSPNVIAAIAAARTRDCRIVGFTGQSGGRIAPLCDVLIAAPSGTTARIQEVHGVCIHAICEALDRRLGVGQS